MSDAIKVKVASAVTVLFLGGIAAAGLITRSGGEDPAAKGASKPLVVQRKVRTVSAAGPPATVPAAAYDAPAAAPSPISTRVSPTGGGGDDDDEGDFDEERESE